MKVRKFGKVSLKQWIEDKPDSIALVEWEEVYDNLKLPKRATLLSAGYDVYSPFDICLKPDESIIVPTGIKAYMEDNNVLLAYPRSGHGFKNFIRLANSTGVIDAKGA